MAELVLFLETCAVSSLHLAAQEVSQTHPTLLVPVAEARVLLTALEELAAKGLAFLDAQDQVPVAEGGGQHLLAARGLLHHTVALAVVVVAEEEGKEAME